MGRAVGKFAADPTAVRHQLGQSAKPAIPLLQLGCALQNPLLDSRLGLLRAHDLLGPAEVRPKWRWMVRDIVRKAKLLDIPLGPPSSHPFNPLLALRVTSLPMDDVVRTRLIDGLFRAVWAGGSGATDPGQIAAVADEAGLDGRAAVERAGESEIKDRLRSQTDDAILRGVFGVPTIVCGGQLFWGYDRPLKDGDLALPVALRDRVLAL